MGINKREKRAKMYGDLQQQIQEFLSNPRIAYFKGTLYVKIMNTHNNFPGTFHVEDTVLLYVPNGETETER